MRRVNSCLALVVAHQDTEIITIEGLADGDDLHPLQRSFIAHDAFQCGYCMLGQICSAVGMLREATIIPSLGDPLLDVLAAFVPFTLGSACLLIAARSLVVAPRASAREAQTDKQLRP